MEAVNEPFSGSYRKVPNVSVQRFIQITGNLLKGDKNETVHC